MYNKYDLKETFSKGIATVVFTKTDGTERVMKGTLLAEYLPNKEFDDSTDEAAERKQNDNILAIWDIDNNGWRSFRIDSIKRLIVE